MSQERKRTRAAREQAAARRDAVVAERRQRGAARQARLDRRRLAWRRVRLWQHGPQFRRRREAWGGLAVVGMLVLLLAYLLTRSWADVVGTALVLLIAGPVVVALVFDRNRR